MKKIKNLRVTVTYSVEICDLDVPDEVYQELTNFSDYDLTDESVAVDWLKKTVSENDALDINYLVDNMIE